VSFKPSGRGLAARGGKELQGFVLAGADRRFHPARAVLDGDSIIVSSEAVAQPVAVRYGWSDNPEQANLTNLDGLPASPFRSDVW
jgi:sialate O-acetylesterase